MEQIPVIAQACSKQRTFTLQLMHVQIELMGVVFINLQLFSLKLNWLLLYVPQHLVAICVINSSSLTVQRFIMNTEIVWYRRAGFHEPQQPQVLISGCVSLYVLCVQRTRRRTRACPAPALLAPLGWAWRASTAVARRGPASRPTSEWPQKRAFQR